MKNKTINIFHKVKGYFLAHKIIGTIIIVAVFSLGYYSYGKLNNSSGVTTYFLGTVQKGTIISSVSGSGQISALSQIDIKPKVSGDIWWIGVKAGDKVYQGQALMSIDNTDAKNALVSAEQSFNSTKLQLQKDETSAPIDYQNAVNALARSKDDLVATYNDTFNTISNTYIDLPTVMTGMKNILFGYDLSANRTQWNYDVLVNMFTDNGDTDNKATLQALAKSAVTAYEVSLKKYNDSLLFYQNISRFSENVKLDQTLADITTTEISVAETLQRELNFISKVIDISKEQNQNLSSSVTTMQNNAKNYLATVNSSINNLLSQKKAIDNAKQTVTTNEQNITLLKVGNESGNNPISLQIAKNNLLKQETDLEQQRLNLSYYTIVAPFSGVIAAVPINNGDTVGTGTSVATLITDQKIATISLNEVDAAKVKVGDKVTATFDAIDGLSITGKVSEVDSVGTVSQGVVSYVIKIQFDIQDVRVKSGMTVNVVIQTAVHTDTLFVPSGSIKTQNGTSYVQFFNPELTETGGTAGITSEVEPQSVNVEIGISDDTNVEILSGLKEGQQIIIRTSSASAKKTTTTTSTRTGGIGGGGIRF